MNIINLIFIGDRFYSESGSWMSSLCTVEGLRFDWGKVTCALMEGHEVHICPATAKEIEHAEKQLAEITS